jgi:hypothetical protein
MATYEESERRHLQQEYSSTLFPNVITLASLLRHIEAHDMCTGPLHESPQVEAPSPLDEMFHSPPPPHILPPLFLLLRSFWQPTGHVRERDDTDETACAAL